MPETEAGARSGREARLGNVEAVLFTEAGDADGIARSLGEQFVETRTLPGGSTLPDWMAALEGASEERLLLVVAGDAPVDPEVIQALLCWPEADALLLEGPGVPRVALLHRETVLASATELRTRAGADVDALLEAVGASRVHLETLGLAPSSAVGTC